ncbi:hypothetical protein OXX79_008028 [Metschnikowia pulcherrima]
MSTVAAPSTVAVGQPAKSNKRLQLESVIREFQSKLGPDWDTYHEALSSFLVGRLSRAELVSQIGPLMKNGLIKYHNRLLLLNFANSLQDTPQEYSSELASFWSKRNARTKGVKSNQYEKFKQNIMGLPLKERRRIRAITKDAGKRDRLSAGITLTRQALLPKIPMLQDKEQQQLQVNNLVQWQQDVVNGINTPMAAASHELPDAETLSRKVLMTSREHGLTGGINARVFEVLSLGLEMHLKNVLECAIDTVRYRRRKYESNAFLQPSFLQGGVVKEPQSRYSRPENDGDKKDIIIGAEDMHNTLEMFPHLLEPGGPQLRLASVMLQNDDQVSDMAQGYALPPKPAQITDVPSSAGSSDKNKDPRSTDNAGAAENGHLQNGRAMAKEPSHIGTVDELKWMLHDLISSS